MTTTPQRQNVRASVRRQILSDEKLPSVFISHANEKGGYPQNCIQIGPQDDWDIIMSFEYGDRSKQLANPAPPSLKQYLVDAEEELRHRLDNANDYFRRKASEVLNDEAALKLLAALYDVGVIDMADIDPCENGIPLAKLTAANFCQIGAKVIYITESGLRFIDSIKNA